MARIWLVVLALCLGGGYVQSTRHHAKKYGYSLVGKMWNKNKNNATAIDPIDAEMREIMAKPEPSSVAGEHEGTSARAEHAEDRHHAVVDGQSMNHTHAVDNHNNYVLLYDPHGIVTDPVVDKILSKVDNVVTPDLLDQYQHNGETPVKLQKAVAKVMANLEGHDQAPYQAIHAKDVMTISSPMQVSDLDLRNFDDPYNPLAAPYAHDRRRIPTDAAPGFYPQLAEFYTEEEQNIGETAFRQTIDMDKVWRYCDGFKPKVFELHGISVRPNPPIAGQWATFTVFGEVKKRMSPILEASFQLRRFKVHETFDHCETHRCPVSKGDFSTDLTYYMFPFMTGNAHGVTTLYERDSPETPILCVNLGPIPIVRG